MRMPPLCPGAAATLAAGLAIWFFALPGSPATALSCIQSDSPIAYDGAARSDDNVYVGRVTDAGTPTTQETTLGNVEGRRYRVGVTRVIKGRVTAETTLFVMEDRRYSGSGPVDIQPGPIFVEATPEGVANVLCGPTTQHDVDRTAARYERALRARGVPLGAFVPRVEAEMVPSPATPVQSGSGPRSGGPLPGAVAASAIGLVAVGVVLGRRLRRER